MAEKRAIFLSGQEKDMLHTLTKKGKRSIRVVKRAKVLLKSEQGLSSMAIAAQTEYSERTIERIRSRFFMGGIERALYDAPRSGQPLKMDTETESYLIATACSDPPEGRNRWTLELLQEKIKKEKKKRFSAMTLWRCLKNRGIKPWLEKNVVHS